MLSDLAGEDLDRARFVLAWARGERANAGPDPRGVCSWLVDVVLGEDEEKAYRAACELVLIANGLRRPRPRLENVPHVEVPRRKLEPEPAPRVLPIHQEPVVKLAGELLGGKLA